MSHEIRCFDYVNHPYAEVCMALSTDALTVFQTATNAAADRAQSVASELRANIGKLEVGAEIAISLEGIDERKREPTVVPATVLRLEWEAAKRPRLFPFMKAELSIYPLTATETQLDLLGHYEPPLGLLGDAVDAVVGHRIAEASVHRFIKDIAKYLKAALT